MLRKAIEFVSEKSTLERNLFRFSQLIRQKISQQYKLMNSIYRYPFQIFLFFNFKKRRINLFSSSKKIYYFRKKREVIQFCCFMIQLRLQGMQKNQQHCFLKRKTPVKENKMVPHREFRTLSENNQLKSSASKQKTPKHFQRKPTYNFSRKKNQRRTSEQDQEFSPSPFFDKKGITMESAISMKSLTRLQENMKSNLGQYPSSHYQNRNNEYLKSNIHAVEKNEKHNESFKTRKEIINQLQSFKQLNRLLEKENKVLKEKNKILQEQNRGIKVQIKIIEDNIQKQKFELQQVRKRENALQMELDQQENMKMQLDQVLQQLNNKIEDNFCCSEKSSIETHSVDKNLEIEELQKQLQIVKQQNIKLKSFIKYSDIENGMIKRENYALSKDNHSFQNVNKKLKAQLRRIDSLGERKIHKSKLSIEHSLQFSLEN